jgi:copper oxidase (laccase) domain-containing protein
MSSRPRSIEDGFIRYLPFSDPNVQVVLSLKEAGDMSDPEGDTSAFCRNAGVSPERVYSLSQVHSRKVITVNAGDRPSNLSSIEADGLISSDRSAALGVTVADCVPVFHFNSRSGIFGAFHSGWKGTGIVLDSLAQMRRLWGSEHGETEAFIGPAFG